MSSLAPTVIVHLLLIMCLFALASDPYTDDWNLSSSLNKAWHKRGTLLLSVVVATMSGLISYQSGKRHVVQ